ncbi:aminotransferase class I/II-fold pyridoxal phosphate-dependent enzyme [Candidatus Riesia pediculicola]|uniref:aminotransferase class I/II-fold pyridoxal phosphate-dependent enzyme n=1 Tax=Candidatus Riesia pediculicola TaxID=401619 RepID=UPI0009E4ED5A|nr:8-amino-7-oxononanoate synthase [Candidatus Riesia pediculicola]
MKRVKNIWESFLINSIKSRKKENNWRTRNSIQMKSSTKIIFKNQEYISFSGNDYLGLSFNEDVKNAWKAGINQYGNGSSSSGHIVGYSEVHRTLEEKLSQWLGYQEALLFSSGYMANQSIVFSLMKKRDSIFADKMSHASFTEASMLSQANFKRFAHNCISSLHLLLKNHSGKKNLVFTEGVFSMDGDFASLKLIHEESKNHNAYLMVDDAHGIGLFGEEGRGSCNVFQIHPEILMIGFGKSFGICGAAILCSSKMKNYLLNYSRSLIYSTMMPPSQAVALLESLRQIKRSNNLRKKLKINVEFFKKMTKDSQVSFLSNFSESGIQPIIVGDNQKCLELSKFLFQNNIWVQAIRPPTVPFGTSRLRIVITANHTFDEIKKLVYSLRDFFDQNEYKK